MTRSSVTSILLIAISHLLGAGDAMAGDGDLIQEFLSNLQSHPWAIEIYHLDNTVEPLSDPAWLLSDGPWKRPKNAIAFTKTIKTGTVFQVLRLSESLCDNCARENLAQAIQVAPIAPPTEFKPDYCVYFVSKLRETQILWISSDPQNLQARYYAVEIIQTDKPPIKKTDQCQLKGDVRQKLETFFAEAAKPPVGAYPLIENIAHQINDKAKPLKFDLMSIGPTQVEDVFGAKRWNALGSVTITTDDIDGRQQVHIAIVSAIDEGARPLHVAHSFTPRLAVSVTIKDSLNHAWANIPKCPSHDCLILFSFECRLAQLYVDQKFQGCCAINTNWPSSGGELEAADQILSNILVQAKQPLAPKSGS